MYEKWDELEHQFRAETKQDAPPFGPGVLEWDYSRYTRALGFGKAPGLDSLRRRACVVASGRYAFRNDAARHLKQWGDDVGWDFIRVSARPSTLVPDPVIYQLGIQVTHPDSLIFCAAGQQGTPVVGKRPRSLAMRIPLTASERWLIAADRVRRRLRCEIATRRLVVFIDDAEYLTPSALTTLSYLLDAQCAWKSHFLSSPAQIYIAFSLPAEHDGWFHETLARFNPLATPFRVREPVGPLTLSEAAKAPNLTVEEEHVAEVLAEAEVALTEEAVLKLFGFSARTTVRSLIRHDIVHQCNERRSVVLRVRDGFRSQRSASKVAAVRAVIDELCRESRFNRGSDAPRFVSRRQSHNQPPAHGALDGATISIASAANVALLFGRRILDAGLVANDVRALSYYSIAVHQRQYQCARSAMVVAMRVTRRSAADTRNLVQMICSTGRTLSDRVFAGEVWSTLTFPGVDSATADLLCVLSELFARLRRMSIEDMTSRHEVTTELFASVFASSEERCTDLAGIRSLCAAILWRNYFLLRGRRVRGNRLSRPPHCTPDLFGLLRTNGVPAYVLGSSLYAHELAPRCREYDGRIRNNIALIRDLQITAGDPADCRVALGLEMNRSVGRSLRLGLSGLADEVILLYDFALPPRGRVSLLHVLFRLFGRTGERVAAARYLLQRGVGKDGPTSLRNATAMVAAPVLARAGELAEARKMCLISAAEQRASGLVRAMATVQVMVLDFESLAWGRFWGDARCSVDFDAADDPELQSCVEEIYRAFGQLARRQFDSAITAFTAARRFVRERLPGESAALHRVATDGARTARRLSSVRVRIGCQGCNTADPAEFLLRYWVRSDSRRGAWSLAVTALLLEEWARYTPAVKAETVISATLSIRRLWGGGLRNDGASLSDVFQRVCPTFFEHLLRSVRPEYSIPMAGNSVAAEIELALESLVDHWDSSSASDYCWELDRALRQDPDDVGLGSLDGTPRNAHLWSEDAALYRGARTVARGLADGSVSPEDAGVVMAGSLDSTVGLWHFREYLVESAGRNFSVAKFNGVRGPGACAQTRRPGVRGCRSSSRPCRNGLVEALVGRPFDVDDVELIGSSEHAQNLRRTIRRASGCAFPVLIHGDTGTGKELIAKLIHRRSKLAHRPMTVANCGAISGSVLEAELFGCVRGAYTGASADRDGLFAAANGTTLLLDELDSMPVRMQAAVLRVLDGGEYRRLGENRVRVSSFRSIAIASSRLLGKLERGEFRQDLYYRLSAVTVYVPPLAERRTDIAEIARWHLHRKSRSIESSCVEYLTSQDWPGNVRQLLQCLDVAASFESRATLTTASLERALAATLGPRDDQGARPASALAGAGGSGTPTFRRGDEFSSADFMAATSVSRRSAQRHLSELSSLGIVERTGAGRSTKYEATESIYWPLPGKTD